MLTRWRSPLDSQEKSAILCRALSQDEVLQGVPLSIDTFYAEVAREAVAAGAHIVNDISGGSLDPAMHQEVLMCCCFHAILPEVVSQASTRPSSPFFSG